MRKGVIALIIIAVVALSAYYYFFVYFQNVRSGEVLEIIDDYFSNLKSYLGVTVYDVSELDYYRYACQFDYNISTNLRSDPKTGEVMYSAWLVNFDCNRDKLSEMLFDVPEDGIQFQFLYKELYLYNGMLITHELFYEKIKDKYSKDGFSLWAMDEILSFIMLGLSSSVTYESVGEMGLGYCMYRHNGSDYHIDLNCLPDFTEAKLKVNEDLVKMIDFGNGFVSSCAQHKTKPPFPVPSEARSIISSRNVADCKYIAEVYQHIFDGVKERDIDPNSKFTTLSTLYVLSEIFRGVERDDIHLKLIDMFKKQLEPGYLENINGIEDSY